MQRAIIPQRTGPLPLVLTTAGLATAAVIGVAGLGAVEGRVAAGIIVTVILPIVAIVLALRFAIGPLARFVARLPYSLRWKIWTAIGATTALFVLVGVNNILAMDYMHQRLHEIQEVARLQPFDIAVAVDDLERTQHGAIFSMAPFLMFLIALTALTLGTAIAWSVIDPVRRTGEAMRRIAAGDFSAPLRVQNRDEIGELAGRINDAARDLERLQEARLLDERAQSLRDRIAQVTLAHEEERSRLSRELHDDLGPSLAAIGNRVRAARALVRSDPERAERELRAVADDLKGSVGAIRALIYDLRPPALDQLGLAGAVRQQLDRWSDETGVPASLHIDGVASANPLVEVTIVRIFQECLSNIGKHAAAGRVGVALHRTPRALRLVVVDDGRGLDGGAAGRGGAGVGLASMRERAELVGGSLCLERGPRGGCRVVLEIPTSEGGDGADPCPAGR